MVKKTIEYFDLRQICRSGQCFRMTMEDEYRCSIIAGERYLRMEQHGREVQFFCGEEEFQDFWSAYFDLHNDYGSYIQQANPNDAYLNQAICFGSGMRILRQDLWETIVSFLISQQNHIGRIRKCIENICVAYGEKRMNHYGEEYYAFPRPEDLWQLPEDALKECNLGYRSKYVVRAAKDVVKGDFNLEKTAELPYKKAKEELMRLFGVGEKVADCICLFSLHHLQAFPVDTHIRQALDRHYKRGFPNRRYRGFQGVMQQYIFYYELWGNKETVEGKHTR